MINTSIRRIKFKQLILVLFLLAILITILSNFTFSEEILENGVEVQPNSELTYYLDVYYDGVDKFGVESSDTTIADLNSSTINITDKLPVGLTFVEFIGASDGSIGAVKRSDGSACLGYVVGGTDGLVYDETTHTVSFQIKNLQAGCKITIGIKTMTPTIDDPSTPDIIENRRDFYNTAEGTEGSQSVISNTVHVWMGTEEATLYNVSYTYDDTAPTNAPALPSNATYTENSVVTLPSINLEGYDFEWTSEEAIISNGKFTMPSQPVTLVGTFKEKPKATVSYKIDGVIPEGYVTPSEKTHYVGSTVSVDSLKVGDIINGYRFLGWTTTEETITDDEFTMPSNDVSFVGQFELVTYTVTYAFQGTVLPDNYQSLIPAPETYEPGATVKLPTIEDVNGYGFIGWYQEDNFTMPEEDITVYGEWYEKAGVFKPTLTISIDKKDNYYLGRNAYFNVTVTNSAAYQITNITLNINNPICNAESTITCTIIDNNTIEISALASGESYTFTSTHYFTEFGTITKEVELMGALASDHYILDDSVEYKASAEASSVAGLEICNEIIGLGNTSKFQYHITGNNFETWFTQEDSSCTKFQIKTGNQYSIHQLDKKEYNLISVSGSITENNGILTPLPQLYKINYLNSYNRKTYFHTWDRVENDIYISNKDK